MNDHWNNPPLGPNAPLGEILLANTAIRIELPPSQHQLAEERYEAVRKHIERQDSPLFNRVRIFYPQGSMAIGATIVSRKRSDGFDIDIIAELMLPHSTLPGQVLDLLYAAINGPPGSRYHGNVERQTRCVTIYYSDGMHLDITPTVLVNELDPRQSHLFHAKPEEPVTQHRRHLMNSFAFCEWFKEKTPIDLRFSKAYLARAMALDEARIRADAEVEAVPAHSTVGGGKSAAVVALQLLKRNRNLRYASRTGQRMPPSVLMAKFTGEAAIHGSSIGESLQAILTAMLGALENAERFGQLIDVTNPKCNGERFNDRWPENREAQRLYIKDLQLFASQLAMLMSLQIKLDAKRDLLVKMFGEKPALAAFDEYASKLGNAVRTGDRVIAPTGRVVPIAGAAAALTSSSAYARPPNHTFFGSRWKGR